MYTSQNITRIYVSQENGSNYNSGFYPDNKSQFHKGPVQTIETALQIVKELRCFGAKQHISIRLLDEEYRVSSPIVIKNDVTDITIEPEKNTVISGAIKIDNLVDDIYNDHKCVSADVSELLSDGFWFTDLYVNEKRAKRTRFPQTGELYADDVENRSTALATHNKWFIAQKKDLKQIATFKNFGDCFISYNHYWVDEHTPIESYDLESGKIVFAYKSRFPIEPTNARSQLRYVIENVSEAFLNEGEWYLDRETKKVYYIPCEGETKDNISLYIPVAKKLIIIEGEASAKAHNITFRNLSFAYTKGDYYSVSPDANGAVQKDDVVTEEKYASDPQGASDAYGSIELKFAKNCSIENCKMNCLGLHAIVLYEGCENVDIRKNTITNGGGGGVCDHVSKKMLEEEYHVRRINISDNIIRACGRRYYASCGILLKHAYESVISHNDISDLYYTGISIGWTWGYDETVTRDNLIEYNHIYKIGQNVLSDMSGIYLLGRSPGTRVINNLVHDVKTLHYGGWGVYPDEGSCYLTIENNIAYDCKSGGFNQNYGSMNVVKNNIFVYGDMATARCLRPENHLGVILDTNILISNDAPVYAICKPSETRAPHFISSSNNIIWDISGKEPVILELGEEKYSLKEMQELFGLEIDSICADPKIQNFEGRNFNLLPDSPAYSKGFKNIDISMVGVRR